VVVLASFDVWAEALVALVTIDEVEVVAQQHGVLL